MGTATEKSSRRPFTYCWTILVPVFLITITIWAAYNLWILDYIVQMNARVTTENIGFSLYEQQKVKISAEIAFICSFIFHLGLNRIRATNVSAFWLLSKWSWLFSSLSPLHTILCIYSTYGWLERKCFNIKIYGYFMAFLENCIISTRFT